MTQRRKKKDDLVRRWRRRKARLDRSRRAHTPLHAPVQLVGEEAAWSRLGSRISSMIKNEGLARLTRLRELIATDANLPMPPILVVPVGWWVPQNGGVIFGMAKPVVVEGFFHWGVMMPASTLVVADDDIVLRRILCHEFAHCFWYTTQMIHEMKDSKYTSIGPKRPDSIQELVHEQLKKDKDELVDPRLWFGEWDAKHFLPEGGPALDRETEMFAQRWIKAGLPAEAPDMTRDAHGPIRWRNEIGDHIRRLDEHADMANKP